MTKYAIILNDGKLVILDATEVEWNEKTKCIRFVDGRRVIARFNMDNIAGWCEFDNISELP